MNIEVLISCMHQTDNSIIERSNIQSNVVVINQCNEENYQEFTFLNQFGTVCDVLYISTTERGLSKSRNMALRNSSGDICLICDDDEILYDDYIAKIKQAFLDNPDSDVIAFEISNTGKIYPQKKKSIGYIGALRLASWQLAFKRNSIINNNICFDESLGSGVSKAGGEENMFLYNCLEKGLKITFVPITIGRMIESESQWFHGFTKEYFFDRGIMTRKLMGMKFALLYALYYIIRKYPQYKKDIGLCDASKSLINGILSK